MANKTIDGLDVIDTINNDDLVVLGDNSTGDTPGTDVTAKKTTIADLSAKIEADLSLGSAATTDSSAYATAAQGALASSAVQSDEVTLNSGGPVAAGSITDVVALTQAEYDLRTPQGTGTDLTTLFVITDGKTKDSYVGQIDTLGNSATYVIDYLPVTPRTVLSFKGEYTGTESGINVTLVVGATTIGTLDLTADGSSGFTVTLSSVPTDSSDKITLVTSGDASAVTDFAFVVEYQS